MKETKKKGCAQSHRDTTPFQNAQTLTTKTVQETLQLPT